MIVWAHTLEFLQLTAFQRLAHYRVGLWYFSPINLNTKKQENFKFFCDFLFNKGMKLHKFCIE